MRNNKTALLAFEALVRSRRVIGWVTDGRARPLHVSFRVCFFPPPLLGGDAGCSLSSLSCERSLFPLYHSLAAAAAAAAGSPRRVIGRSTGRCEGRAAAALAEGARSKPAEWETRLCVVSCVRMKPALAGSEEEEEAGWRGDKMTSASNTCRREWIGSAVRWEGGGRQRRRPGNWNPPRLKAAPPRSRPPPPRCCACGSKREKKKKKKKRPRAHSASSAAVLWVPPRREAGRQGVTERGWCGHLKGEKFNIFFPTTSYSTFNTSAVVPRVRLASFFPLCAALCVSLAWVRG